MPPGAICVEEGRVGARGGMGSGRAVIDGDWYGFEVGRGAKGYFDREAWKPVRTSLAGVSRSDFL